MGKRVLITGSNRGIGFEFVRQYLEDGWRVYATCRRPGDSQELNRLLQVYQELSIHRLDITVQEDISNLCHEVDDVPIDLLVNNAGVYFKSMRPEIGCLHYDYWLRTLEVNTLGTMRITEALLDNIGKSRKHRLIAVLSSDDDNVPGCGRPPDIYYRSSKAALNAAMQALSLKLLKQDIGVLLLHPGSVVTRMGSDNGISAQRSVVGMRDVIESFDREQSGHFLYYDGTAVS